MREVESLSPHLGTNPSVVNLEHQPTKRGISKVEIPHILEGTLVDLTERGSRLARSCTTKGVSASSSRRHLLNNAECVLEQSLLDIVLLNRGLDLTTDRFPHIVERRLGSGQLAAVVIQRRVDAELVV